MWDFNTPSYQLNAADAYLPRYWMASYWLWYAFGPTGHTRYDEFVANRHTSQEAKSTSEYAQFVKHKLLHSKYFHPSYQPNQNNVGNSSLWEEVKDIITDPYLAPLMAKDLGGLPKTLIVTANYDVLRDDGLMYAKRLEMSGVKVKVMHYDKTFHAVMGHRDVQYYAEKATTEFVEYLRQHL